jgi:hypothetical protein
METHALELILSNLLTSRVKAEDAPASSDQHWCTAIAALAELIPDCVPEDPERLYEYKYALLNQEVLYGRMTSGDAIAELDKYEAVAQEASFVPPQYRELYKRDRPPWTANQTPPTLNLILPTGS